MMLKDKVAVITGAGGGLGRAVAERLANEGAKLVLVDLKQEAAQQTIDIVKGITDNVLFVQANVTKKDDVQNFVNVAVKKFNSIDRKSTRLNSSHVSISYADFCLKKKTN